MLVTRYKPGEHFAAGEFPVTTTAPENLLSWTRDNEGIQNTDVVAWYTLGVTHVARPEEYPVMPTAHASVRLVPKGFFETNPRSTYRTTQPQGIDRVPEPDLPERRSPGGSRGVSFRPVLAPCFRVWLVARFQRPQQSGPASWQSQSGATTEAADAGTACTCHHPIRLAWRRGLFRRAGSPGSTACGTPAATACMAQFHSR